MNPCKKAPIYHRGQCMTRKVQYLQCQLMDDGGVLLCLKGDLSQRVSKDFLFDIIHRAWIDLQGQFISSEVELCGEVENNYR